jgi:hypothetical protein
MVKGDTGGYFIFARNAERPARAGDIDCHGVG